MISDELRKYRDEAAPPPSREETKGLFDTREARLAYNLGFHHAMDEAIEIAENEEDA